MTTLADMTPEERAERTGVWCEVAISKALFIYTADDQKDEEMAVVVNPRSQFRTTAQLHVLTPRYDLPRAWMPDGQPPQGRWEYSDEVKASEVGGGWTFTKKKRWVNEWSKA